MHKDRITKQKIFAAAKVIAHLDKEPTMARVREHLVFTGSQTTLQKYLKEWRLKCFKTYDANRTDDVESKDIVKLQTENQILVANIAKMEEHNKIVASEFAKTERKNVELIQRVNKLETQLHLWEEELGSLKKDKEHADNLCQEVKEERDLLLGKMERGKDQLIASLREELKQTHQTSLQQIQDVSYHGHDLLMQEKVKSMNLEEKVKFLMGDMLKVQQDLNNANQAVEPLKTRIICLQKLIAENLTSEQLHEYEKKQQLLDFANNNHV